MCVYVYMYIRRQHWLTLKFTTQYDNHADSWVLLRDKLHINAIEYYKHSQQFYVQIYHTQHAKSLWCWLLSFTTSQHPHQRQGSSRSNLPYKITNFLSVTTRQNWNADYWVLRRCRELMDSPRKLLFPRACQRGRHLCTLGMHSTEYWVTWRCRKLVDPSRKLLDSRAASGATICIL